MKLKLVRHLWGVNLKRDLSDCADHWRKTGYEAVEISLRSLPDRSRFLQFLKDQSFQWVPQVFSHDFKPGGTVRQHLASLREQMEECLDRAPLFFNAHSGFDAWSETEAEDFYAEALDLEKELGVPVSHETHRLRYFGIPWQTRHILHKFPGLRVTCDFSHWVCVCERLLPDLGETIALAAQHCHHLHARVGFAEGPQVPDPSAPEYAAELAAHEAWWDQVWQSQEQRGFTDSTLTPELGPPPYMHTLPHTGVPVADLPTVCDWMAHRQRARFQRQYAA
jgi:hypothetical protein